MNLLRQKTPAEKHKAKFGSRDKDIELSSKAIGPSKSTFKEMFNPANMLAGKIKRKISAR